MVFTVQHTCKKEGGREYVEKNVPFYSDYDLETNSKPFIGAGYYFWEYNFEYAKIWGKNHYNNSYFIAECKIIIENNSDDSYYLDLAGNREHLVGFVELLMEFDLIDKKGVKGIDLCYIISYLRDLSEKIFPFKVIRAVDYKNNEISGIKIAFNDKGDSYTILNPRIIISYKNKEDIVYNTEPFITFAK